MNKTSKRYAVAIALVLIYAVAKVGTMDHQDAELAGEHYRAMVCAGYWPDYDNRQPDCSNAPTFNCEQAVGCGDAGVIYPKTAARYE
jgi:hypothetical protein